ncbi:MAG: hypothetical protein ACXACB_06805, partial [Promethearchaeota archaeon]
MSHYNRFVIRKKLQEYIEEDCTFGDITSSIISDYDETSAKIHAKSAGYVSGLEELKILFEILDVSTTFRKKDGDAFQKGDIIVELKGNT